MADPAKGIAPSSWPLRHADTYRLQPLGPWFLGRDGRWRRPIQSALTTGTSLLLGPKVEEVDDFALHA